MKGISPSANSRAQYTLYARLIEEVESASNCKRANKSLHALLVQEAKETASAIRQLRQRASWGVVKVDAECIRNAKEQYSEATRCNVRR